MSWHYHHLLLGGSPCGLPREDELPFEDTFDTLGTCPILSPTGQITYEGVPGTLASADINALTVNSWGGIESLYNTHDPSDPNRATGWYSNGFGKTYTLRALVDVPGGATQMRVQFDFYLAWARNANSGGVGGNPTFWERMYVFGDKDGGVNRQGEWIDNTLIDGVNYFATTWYHPSDWAVGTSLRKFDVTMNTSAGPDAINFGLSQSATGGMGITHPTLSNNNGRRINCGIDNLVITFS